MESKLLKITLFIALLLISSAIYISTYWGDFGINILPFIDINQLFLYALFPIINRVLFFVLGVIIALLFFSNIFPFGGYEIKVEKGKATKFDKVFKIIIGVFIFLLWPSLMAWVYFINIEKYYFFFPGVLTIYSVFVLNYLVKYKLAAPSHLDSAIISIMIYILCSSYSVGKLNSRDILMNTKFKFTQINNEYFKFLGKAGNQYIFLSLDNSKENIINIDDLKLLELYKYDGQITTHNDSIVKKEIDKIELDTSSN